MATSIVKADMEIIDNMIVISLPEGIEDNCQYEIRFKNLQSFDGNSFLDSYTHKVVTALNPAYAKVSDVAILVDTFKIPESTVLYYIREASKYADYIVETEGANMNSGDNKFAMTEFVKTKTMIDCLMAAYVKKAAGSGVKGKLGEIAFEDTDKYATSIGTLLDKLWARLKLWEDALRGYELEGRAKPKYAIRGSKAKELTVVSQIADTVSRDLPIL